MSGLEASVALSRAGFALDAELAAPRGPATAVLGPNGAGKSTLVAALAGLLPLDAGRVTLDARVWEAPEDGIRLAARERRVGVAFQDARLFPWLSALDNVAYGARSRGVGREEARRGAAEWLERLGAGGLAGRRPGALSGGEAQRVALARALAAGPELLLLDEPLSAQDLAARGAARHALEAALADFDGVALIVTHDPVEALTLAARVVVLEEGRVVQQGEAEELRRRPATPWIAALAGVNLLHGRLVVGPEGAFLESGAIRLAVLAGAVEPGSRAAAVFPPTAVILSAIPPKSSARNVIAGRVAAIDRRGDRARVTLGTDPPSPPRSPPLRWPTWRSQKASPSMPRSRSPRSSSIRIERA